MSKSIQGYATRRKLAAAKARIEQLEFIITQAPFVMVPEDGMLGLALARMQKSTVPYAYIHPATFHKVTQNYFRGIRKPFYQLPKSPTHYVPTSLLPEGTIIFTPNKMPGIDGI